MGTRKLIIFVVAAVLALILSYIVVTRMRVAAVMSRYNDGRYRAGPLGVKSLQGKVELYVFDVGSLPTSLDDLISAPTGVKGWRGPYGGPSDLVDPFGHPFAYKVPGDHGAFDIVFLGQDGKPGGVHNDADVGNWELKTK